MTKKLGIFQKQKQECLNKEDLSLKGSIDEPIRPLVDIINSSEFYYTTSTCSGRISIVEKPLGQSNVKKGNQFHLSSHCLIELQQVNAKLKSLKLVNEPDRCFWLKFEPFIVHVQCYNLAKAKSLLDIALNSGCRNSGMTLNKNCDKFMVAIRSTSSMEAPIHCSSLDFGFTDNHFKFLCDEANRRLEDNFTRLDKLENQIQSNLSRE